MPDGINRYAYVGNNPINYRDPSGLLMAATNKMISDMNSNYFGPDSYAFPLQGGATTYQPVWSADATTLQLVGGEIGGAIVANVLSKVIAPASKYVSSEVSAAWGAVKSLFGAGKSVENNTIVGRWMSEVEHTLMQKTGKVQESLSGTTHVANPANAAAFMKQATSGSRYVEFSVPANSLKMTNQGWAKIIGPNSLEGRLAARKGLTIPEMPTASDMKWLASKL